jgi:transcription factor TFIIIB component B''
MSSRTTVSASVIKSTSRFAPKAVPRKPQRAPPSKSTPAPQVVDEDESESEHELQDENATQLLEEDEGNQASNGMAIINKPVLTSVVDMRTAATRVQSTVPSTATPISIPSIHSNSLPTALPTELSQATSAQEQPSVPATTRKRRQQTSDSSTRRRRKSTPPTAEEVVIVPSTAKMSEMCVDKRTGRKSARYAELREAERQRKRLKELKKEQEQSGIEIDIPEPIPPNEDDDTLAPVTSGTARVMTDENGNIILDQSSLQVDRHAIHPSTLTESLVHTTETVFSSKTNSATYPSTRSHASNAIRWLPEDHERFYNGLRMFGTDFGLIATYVGGGKQRRHIKNKFDREEKSNGGKITWALKNRLDVNLAELEERRGSKFKALEEIQVELDGLRAEAELVKALPPLSQLGGQSETQSGRRSYGKSIITEALEREYE